MNFFVMRISSMWIFEKRVFRINAYRWWAHTLCLTLDALLALPNLSIIIIIIQQNILLSNNKVKEKRRTCKRDQNNVDCVPHLYVHKFADRYFIGFNAKVTKSQTFHRISSFYISFALFIFFLQKMRFFLFRHKFNGNRLALILLFLFVSLILCPFHLLCCLCAAKCIIFKCAHIAFVFFW